MGATLSSSPATNPPHSSARVAQASLLSYDEHHVAGTCGPIFIVNWKGVTSVPVVQSLRERILSFAALMQRRIALFTIIDEAAPLPTSDARLAVTNVLRSCSDDLCCSAVTMEGDGFRAAAVRSVATGLAFLARQPYPHRVFPQTHGALVWMTTHLGGAAELSTVANMEESIRSMRAEPERFRRGSASLAGA